MHAFWVVVVVLYFVGYAIKKGWEYRWSMKTGRPAADLWADPAKPPTGQATGQVTGQADKNKFRSCPASPPKDYVPMTWEQVEDECAKLAKKN